MITVKEEFVGCDKYRRAVKLGGPDAILMWLALKAYVAKYLTDGFVADEEIDNLEGAPKRNRERALRALLECGRRYPTGHRGAGLVERTAHGWMLHDYLDHAESADEIRERRDRETQRKREYRARKRNESALGVPVSQTGQSVGQARDKKPDTGSDCPTCPVGDSPAGPRTRVPSPLVSAQDQDPPKPPKGGDGKRGPRKERAKPLPADWEPKEQHEGMAKSLGLSVAGEAEAFRDHAKQTGRILVDWDAGFRSWLRKAPEMHSNPHASPQLALSQQPAAGVTGYEKARIVE